jgi:hypothetical protein
LTHVFLSAIKYLSMDSKATEKTMVTEAFDSYRNFSDLVRDARLSHLETSRLPNAGPGEVRGLSLSRISRFGRL